MSLTRSQLVKLARRNSVDGLDGWSDAQVLNSLLQEKPELADLIIAQSPGELAYEKYGSRAAAGFGKRFAFQFGTQWEEMKAGLMGLQPWTETQASEKARAFAEKLYMRKVADDPELQALLAWKEDEPGWTNFDTAVRSASEVLPSLALAATGTITGLAASWATGGSSLGVTAASLAPMFFMEAGGEQVAAMRTMVDEMGMDPEEARGYAGVAAVSYGLISSILERAGAKSFLKLVPGLNIKTVEGELLKNITRGIVRSGVDRNFLVRGGTRALAGVTNTLAGSLREGTTEWAQAVTQHTINQGMKYGMGDDATSVLDAIQRAFKESLFDKEVLEEGFAGATMGILGLPSGILTRTAIDKKALDYSAMSMGELKLEAAKNNIDLSGIDKRKKSSIIEAIKKGAPVEEEVVVDEGETVKREEVKEEEVPEKKANLINRFFSALAGNDSMSEVLDEVDETTPTGAAIAKGVGFVSTGAKIISFIKGDPSRVDSIASHENGDILLGAARDSINEELVKQGKKPIGTKRIEIINALKAFAQDKTSGVSKKETGEEFDVGVEEKIDLGDFTTGEVGEPVETEEDQEAKDIYDESLKDVKITGFKIVGSKLLQSISRMKKANSRIKAIGNLKLDQVKTLAKELKISIPKKIGEDDIKSIKDKIYEKIEARKPSTKEKKLSALKKLTNLIEKGIENESPGRKLTKKDKDDIRSKVNSVEGIKETISQLKKDLKKGRSIETRLSAGEMLPLAEDVLEELKAKEKSKPPQGVHPAILAERQKRHDEWMKKARKRSLKDLRDVAKANEIPNYKNMSKEELLAALDARTPSQLIEEALDFGDKKEKLQAIIDKFEKEDPNIIISDKKASKEEKKSKLDKRSLETIARLVISKQKRTPKDFKRWISALVKKQSKQDKVSLETAYDNFIRQIQEYLTDPFVKKDAGGILDSIIEDIRALAVSKKKVTTTKSGIKIWKQWAPFHYNTFKEIILEKGKKTYGWFAAWFGDVGYTYSGITHDMQTMPDEFKSLAREIEKHLGLKEGYFNSALANILPKGKGIGAHADDEVIFVRENGTIGKVATISIGGSTSITITDKKTGKTIETINVNEGDLYVMPGQRFQLEKKHAVGPSGKDRISITFRHIPKSVLEKVKKKKKAEDYIDLPKIVYKKTGRKHRTGDIVAASYSKSKNEITIDKDEIQKKYDEKAWTKPKVEGVDPLPEDAFKTVEEFESFVIMHELAHSRLPQKKGESKGAYENRMNKEALKEAPEVTSRSFEDFIDKAIVNEAMEKGEKDIPQSIINKYPDLAKKYGYKVEVETPKKKSRKEVVDEFIGSEEITDPNDQPDADTNVEKDFQDENSSDEQYAKDNKKLVNKMFKRLKKHFPFIDVKTFEGLLKIEGINRIGFAMEKLVAWSTTDGRLDTLPHEFAHIYVKMLINEKIIKLGIKKFGSEELLVRHIGRYYTNRMRNRSLLGRFKIWLKQFVNRLRINTKKNIKGDIGDFIAEEFYQGRWLGINVAVGEQFLAFDDARDEESGSDPGADGQQATKLNSIPSTLHLTHIFSKALGVYIDQKKHYAQIMKIANNSKSFEEYVENLYAWAKEMTSERQRVGDDKLRSFEDLQEWEKRELHQIWVSALVRIARFVPGNEGRLAGKQGKDTRIYEEWIIQDNVDKNPTIRVSGTINKVTGKHYAETNTRNFVEQDYVDGQHESRLLILPVKSIMRRFKRKVKTTRSTIMDAIKGLKPKEINDYHIRGNSQVSMDTINSMVKLQRERYRRIIIKKINDLRQETLNKIKKGGDKDTEITNMISALKNIAGVTIGGIKAFVGTKMGDNSALLSTVSKINPFDISMDSFTEFLQGEVDNGNMTKKHMDQMINDVKYDSYKTESLQTDLESTLEELVNRYIDPSKSIDFEGLKKAVNLVLSKKSGIAQSMGRYKFWQNIRVPDYLMHEKSVADSMQRLSIDLAEGPNPKNAGKAKLMLIDKDVSVKVEIKGKMWDAGTYGDYDGATMTSTRYLTKMAKALGYKKLRQIKTFIRQRTVNKDGTVDYLGMKHMQFNPFKKMKFYRGDLLIAEVRGKGSDTWFVDMNPDSPTYGQSFDMIASPNEAKMAFGKFDKENDGFYKLHDIEENSIKITTAREQASMSAAHPIALGEMLLSAIHLEGGDKAADLIKAIRGNYSTVINHYTQQIKAFYADSSLFKSFLNKMKQDGEVDTELDEYIALLEEDGLGVFHPVILNQVLSVINSKIIRDGILKARSANGTSSRVYIKPGVHLWDKIRGIKNDSVMISSDNRVAVKQVEIAYYLATEENPEITKKGNIKGYKKWRRKKAKEDGWVDQHQRIKALNEWLEVEGNDVHVLIHRNPIAKITGPVLRKVQKLVEGEQGATIFLSYKDVKEVLDGDWDGDEASFEFIDRDYKDAMESWQNSPLHASLDKVVSLDMFGMRVDKDPALSDTSVASWEDIAKAVVSNSKADGATGVNVNAKTMLNQFFVKGFKIYPDSLKENNGYIEAISPTDEVVMDYIPLNKEQLLGEDGEYLNIIKKNADRIVFKRKDTFVEIEPTPEAINKVDGDIYLLTTKQHELSVLFQMAVDHNKYKFWGDIINESKLDNFNFLISKMFQTNEGKDLTKGQRDLIRLAWQTQNISKMRGGLTEDGDKGTYEDNIEISNALDERFNGGEIRDEESRTADMATGMLSDTEYANNFYREMMRIGAKSYWGYKGEKAHKIEMFNIITPVEELLLGLSDALAGINEISNPVVLQHAHVGTMEKLWDAINNEDLISTLTEEEYNKARNFIYKKRKQANGQNLNFAEIWGKLLQETVHKKSVRSDLNIDFANFIDKFLDEFNALPSKSKTWITLEYLTHEFNNVVYVQKLLPLKLMDKNLIKRYLREFEITMRKLKPFDIKKVEAQKMREQLGYSDELKNMHKKFNEADNAVKACKT